MASVRFYHPLALILSLWAGDAHPQGRQDPPQLYDRPVLAVDPGMHTAPIKSASADRGGRWVVTGSDDKTVRIWSLAEGKLERTIRMPAGPGDVGKVYAVAMSPDAALIAAGTDLPAQIYLFNRETGALVKRIEGLPNNTVSLAFSPDGARLAAGLNSGGLHVYARERGWGEAARDEDYTGGSMARTLPRTADSPPHLMAAKFAYTRPTWPARFVPPPRSIPLVEKNRSDRVSPADGDRLAVGYADTARVDLLDGHSLAALPPPDMTGAEEVHRVIGVGWSRDGAMLLAGGAYFNPAVQCSPGAKLGPEPGDCSPKQAMSPILSSDCSMATCWWSTGAGSPGWARRNAALDQQSHLADFRSHGDVLKVSADGARVEFGFETFGQSPARFDLATRTLVAGAGARVGTARPKLTGLPVDNWEDNRAPRLGGKQLGLVTYEISRSLAIHPTGESFVLGTDWYLRAFDAQGAPLWSHPAPGIVWAVNITGDGRLVVAAYGDGTIRWHRMTDGAELLAFMPIG